MSDKRKKKALLVYIIFVLCFIWGQSVLPGDQSSGESMFVLEKLIHPLERVLFGRTVSTEWQVRKAAHVFEYTMLALGLGGYLYLRESPRIPGKERFRRAFFRSLSCGLAAALADETVQLFSGRGSMVSDIWIDGAGVLAGTLLSLLVIRLRQKRRDSRSGKESRESTDHDH